MLVIHGDKDYRVPIGEGLRLWAELAERVAARTARMPHKFLYFPDENHWVLKPAAREALVRGGVGLPGDAPCTGRSGRSLTCCADRSAVRRGRPARARRGPAGACVTARRRWRGPGCPRRA